jgi:uncharacterized protein (TIGR03067 family)
MIRHVLLFGLILIATCSSADDKKELPKELMPFQGTWKLIKVERGGMEPKGGLPEAVHFTFEGNKLSIMEGKANADTGTYSVDSKKDPAEIDLVNSKGEKTQGIYKFDKDGKLTMSYNKKDAMRLKKFGGGEPETVLIVLEKMKK